MSAMVDSRHADGRSLVADVPTGLYIGGRWRPAGDGAVMDVIDPATRVRARVLCVHNRPPPGTAGGRGARVRHGGSQPRGRLGSGRFGGVKQSGIGREGGHEGLLDFTEAKYIAVDW
jgi:acyl-CoA reductase-like NAD-dependent aldehyde dehydrogenase